MAESFSSPFTVQLAQTPVSKDPKVLPDLMSLYNSIQLLQQAFTDFCGVTSQPAILWSTLTPANTILAQNANRVYLEASENISAGAIISLHLSGGLCKIRNANATNNTKPGHGYMLSAVTSGNIGEAILFNGLNVSISGLTIGQRYFLSTTNGLITATAPVAAGNIEQAVGIALASNLLYFKTDLDFVQH